MTLAKMGKESNIKTGFKNKHGFILEEVSQMDLFAFDSSKVKEKKDIKIALKYIIQGNEQMLYANSDAEIAKLEEIFDTWKNIKDPKIK